MKSTELRIGNWIEYDNNGTPIYVTMLGRNDCYYNSDCYSPYKSMNGIPLTEEWLLKFGFDKKNIQFYSKEIGDNVFILVNYNTRPTGCYGAVTFETDLKENSYVGHIWRKCKHVHSLQNLYFALTGTEIEVL